MKSFTVCAFALCALLVVSCANANSQDAVADVLKYENNNIGVDGFNYEFQTSNAIKVTAEGSETAVKGSYSYIAPDGVEYKIDYIADENGFQPQGDHIPRAQ